MNIFSIGFFKELEAEEGYRSRLYDDSTGKTLDISKICLGNATIGIGCNIHYGISYALARNILEFQLNDVAEQIAFAYPVFARLSTRRQEALIEIAFNCGFPRFQKFRKMLHALVLNDFKTAALECLDSDAARQLPKRYARIADKIRNG